MSRHVRRRRAIEAALQQSLQLAIALQAGGPVSDARVEHVRRCANLALNLLSSPDGVDG